MDSTGQPKRRRGEPHRIPDELQSEILLRLPVRSVIRFRCVCKLWRSKTHDPYFIDAHLDRTRRVDPPSILLFLKQRDSDRYGITIVDQNSKPPNRILWGPKPYGEGFIFANSCNGLICIYGYNEGEGIKVINPSTGESLTLPEKKYMGAGYNEGFYLGFHPETKEYKVISFFSVIKDLLAPVACEVYTLGTCSWRQIPNGDPQCFFLRSPITVKGVVYWLREDYNDNDDESTNSVLSFDLKHENFTRIPFPSLKSEEAVVYDDHLVEIHDSVCFSASWISSSQKMDIWMLMINVDTHNTTKYEWPLKYSIILPVCDGFGSTPLLIHNEEILVHTTSWKVDPTDVVKDEYVELIYYHLNSKCRGRKKVFYRERKSASPPIYHYLKGQFEINNKIFCDYKYYRSAPFVHIESLVPLRSQREAFELSEKLQKLESLQASDHDQSYALAPTGTAVAERACSMIKKEKKRSRRKK